MKLSDTYYLVDMSTDGGHLNSAHGLERGRNLYISAYAGSLDLRLTGAAQDNTTSTTLELAIKACDPFKRAGLRLEEKLHRQLYRETNGDYRRIVWPLKLFSLAESRPTAWRCRPTGNCSWRGTGSCRFLMNLRMVKRPGP